MKGGVLHIVKTDIALTSVYRKLVAFRIIEFDIIAFAFFYPIDLLFNAVGNIISQRFFSALPIDLAVHMALGVIDRA